VVTAESTIEAIKRIANTAKAIWTIRCDLLVALACFLFFEILVIFFLSFL
jgi:hypothetical protein